MTTSIEYEEKAEAQINLIEELGMKAIECARIYAQLAQSAAMREQAEAIESGLNAIAVRMFK